MNAPEAPAAPQDPSVVAIEESIALVAETIGELMEFWSFKPSMGRVWSVLYLSRGPLSAEEICTRTGLSSGSVSMTLNELRLWGVVRRSFGGDQKGGRRRKLYAAETDILAMVTRVFRDRELRQVQRTVASLEQALAILEAQARSKHPDTMLRSRFVLTRVRHLLTLARMGERMLARLAESGALDLSPMRDWLSNLRRRS